MDAYTTVSTDCEETGVHESEVSVSVVNRSPGHVLIGVIKIVWLLAIGLGLHVRPGQRVEGGQLDPSEAHLIKFSYSLVTADICSCVRDAKHVHVHDSSDRKSELLPCSHIFSKPVGGVLACTCEGTSSENEGSSIFSKLVYESPVGLSHHVTIQIV